MPGQVIELKNDKDKRFFNQLMARYHTMGVRPGLAKGRYFVYVVDGYWVAGAYLQPPDAFIPVFHKFRLDTKRSYFIRRIAKFCPGDYLVEFLGELAKKLRDEGKELLVTLGLEDHSNALYKHAGFRQIGYTRSGKPVFVKQLN